MDKDGYLELILGPMFSGKSTKLIQYIRKYKTLKYSMIIIKPNIDTRYTANNEICTHDYVKENCIVYGMNELHNIYNEKLYNTTKIIIIEEGQFFNNIYDIIKKMVDDDKKIIYISALNGDSNRNIFGDIYKLIPICNNIVFLKSLCIECNDGTLGIFSKRLINSKEQIAVGGSNEYIGVCRKHYLNDNI